MSYQRAIWFKIVLLVAVLFTNSVSNASPFPILQQGVMLQNQFQPQRIAGLSLWLRSDAFVANDGDTLATWADKSGNGCDAAQATSWKRPLYKVNQINGKPAVKFDGSDDQLDGCSKPWQHFFAVVYIDASPVNHQYLWGATGADLTIRRQGLGPTYGHGNGNDFAPNGNYMINGSVTNSVANGTWHIVEAASATQVTWSYSFGCTSWCGSRNWKGLVAETLVYSSTLSSINRQKIEGYLAHKYGLAASLPAGHPYLTTAP